MVEFFMSMSIVPTATHQMKQVTVRNGKPIFYEPDEVKAVRSKLMAHLAKHKTDSPMDGPVQVITKWCFPITGKHFNGEWKATKPDCTNLQKMLEDCMTDSGFWHDDQQIASTIIQKFWAEVPGIYIKVESLTND